MLVVRISRQNNTLNIKRVIKSFEVVAVGRRGKDGADGKNALTVSATAPLNPVTGDLWYQP